MSELVPLFPVEQPTLEDVILEALASARDSARTHDPVCPVCGTAASPSEVERGIYEITCSTCGSVLTEAHDELAELRLAS